MVEELREPTARVGDWTMVRDVDVSGVAAGFPFEREPWFLQRGGKTYVVHFLQDKKHVVHETDGMKCTASIGVMDEAAFSKWFASLPPEEKTPKRGTPEWCLWAMQKRYGDWLNENGFQPIRVINEATVMHVGWELDNHAWLVEMSDGSITAWHTNHGGLYPCERKYLAEKIEETKESLRGLTALYAAMPKDE